MIQGYAASAAKATLAPLNYAPAALGPHDIEVRITHCGICHSDVHLIDNDWGISTYPLVPGHEIIGTVAHTGSMVQHLKVGQRVGIGWQRSACLSCEFCVRGDENLCSAQTATCVRNHGGFADRIVSDARFAFSIPEALASENAAPLLCGGITVYAPLRIFEIKPHMKVGIIGIGGLGHLAVQFAAAMGCHVTAFSSSHDKAAEAKTLGAHEFVATKDPSVLAKYAGRYDFILSTANADLPWLEYVNALRPDGRLCFVGIPNEPLHIPVFTLLGGRKSICASPIGGRALIQEMLEFAARHQIAAQTEVMPLSQVNQALEKVRKNTARYRMVLKASH